MSSSNDMAVCDPCTCVIEPGQKTGWCDKHKMRKTANWVRLCQTQPGYRKAWDEGRGPGQKLPKRDPIDLHTGKRVKRGVGGHLRRVLGCCAKKWPHYDEMDQHGVDISQNSIMKFAESLVREGYVKHITIANRLIKIAIQKARE